MFNIDWSRLQDKLSKMEAIRRSQPPRELCSEDVGREDWTCDPDRLKFIAPSPALDIAQTTLSLAGRKDEFGCPTTKIFNYRVTNV